jgi:hypothetical protein
MDNFIRIHFRGICTHLVNGSPHSKAPKDVGMRPIHDPKPTPSHRVVLPRSDNVPKELGIPQHFPRLRFRSGDIPSPFEWPVEVDKEGFFLVDITHMALWFNGINEKPEKMPPPAPALALKELPSIWINTPPVAVPRPDESAVNEANTEKVVTYIDFFGGQHLAIIPSPPFYNEVLATLPLASTPALMWRPFGQGAPMTTPIKPGATIQIMNVADTDSCRNRDYLLHYRVTELDLTKPPLPDWSPPSDDCYGAGTDTPYCSSGTYP